MIQLVTKDVFSVNATIHSFTVGENSHMYVVTKEGGTLCLRVYENKKEIKRIDLEMFTEDAHFYLIELYKENMYIIANQGYVCGLTVYNMKTAQFEPRCSFLLNANVYHLDRNGIVWIGLSDEGVFAEWNPQGKGMFAMQIVDQMPIYEKERFSNIVECYGLGQKGHDLLAVYEDNESNLIIDESDTSAKGSRLNTYLLANLEGIANYRYYDKVFWTGTHVLLANNHSNKLALFSVHDGKLKYENMKLDRNIENEKQFSFSEDVLYIANRNEVYTVDLKFFQHGWQGVYLQKIRLLLEQAIQGDITHLELSDECEKILFTEEHLTDKVRDLIETVTMQWDLYITNTIDSDRLTEGINLSHLSLPRNWLDGWLEEVKRVEETLEKL